jgi:hypothetical protein
VNNFYKIVTFTIADNLDQVKSALFEAGAGELGSYDSCCFVSKGIGQYRPLKGSIPTVGKINVIEQVEEFRIEIICSQAALDSATKAIRAAHCYEEPAIYITSLESQSFKR